MPTSRLLIFTFSLSLGSIFAAFLSITHPLIMALIAALTLGGILLWKYPVFGINLILINTVFGELSRLPYGPENGLLLNDILIPFIVSIWFIKKLLRHKSFPPNEAPRANARGIYPPRASLAALQANDDSSHWLTPRVFSARRSRRGASCERKARARSEVKNLAPPVLNQASLSSKLTAPFLIFISIAFISLLNGSRYLESSVDLLASSFYLVRFFFYFMLYYLTLDIVNSAHKQDIFVKNILISAVFIAIAGFIQLIFVPDFSEYSQKYGWDPHQNRLLGTWFDPNFIGGFFSLILTIIAALILNTKKHRFLVILAGATLLIALFLTYSRSAYLAFAISIFALGILRSRQLIILGIAAGMILLPLSDRAQERLQGFYNSAKALTGIGTEITDPTAELRLRSWSNTLQLINTNPWLGTGYNTLRYVQHQVGFIEDTGIHHAAGSDSSLLTILSTTGIFGLLSFFWLYGTILTQALGNWLQSKNSSLRRALSLGFGCALIGLLAHSFFVNSLLFAPIMVYIWILAALVENTSKEALKNYVSSRNSQNFSENYEG